MALSKYTLCLCVALCILATTTQHASAVKTISINGTKKDQAVSTSNAEIDDLIRTKTRTGATRVHKVSRRLKTSKKNQKKKKSKKSKGNPPPPPATAAPTTSPTSSTAPTAVPPPVSAECELIASNNCYPCVQRGCFFKLAGGNDACRDCKPNIGICGTRPGGFCFGIRQNTPGRDECLARMVDTCGDYLVATGIVL